MAKAKGKKKTEVLDYGAQVRSLREQGPGRLYRSGGGRITCASSTCWS